MKRLGIILKLKCYLMGNKTFCSLAGTDLADGVYRQKNDLTNSSNKIEISNISFCKRNVQRHLSVYSIISTRRNCGEDRPILQLEACFLPIFPLRVASLENSYEFVKNISHGSFSEIYLVEKGQTRYVLKLYTKHQIISEESVERTNEEVQILKASKHNPFIINVVDNWQSKRYLYIVCDYYRNGDLFEFIQEHILPLDLIKLYIAQIALALDFLHNAGIIHRDVKLENFFLDDWYNLKLGDFDLARWLPYGSRADTICGSFRYMAPEIRMNLQYGHAVDWWSLGAVACRMLTDNYPHTEIKHNSDNNDSVTLKVNYSEEYLSLQNDQKELLQKLLEIDESKRLKSLRALQNIRYYFEYNVEDVRTKKISGTVVIKKELERMQNENYYENFDITV